MLRFRFFSHETINCGDCIFRSSCSRKVSGKQVFEMCENFKRSEIKPKVTIASADYMQLVKQLSHRINTAERYKEKHMRMSFGESYLEDIPPYTECNTYIDISKVFLDYLDEFRDMFSNSPSILELLLQTVFSVDDKKKVVKIYTDDKLLLERINEFVKMTKYKLFETTYEEILGINVKQKKDFISF